MIAPYEALPHPCQARLYRGGLSFFSTFVWRWFDFLQALTWKDRIGTAYSATFLKMMSP